MVVGSVVVVAAIEVVVAIVLVVASDAGTLVAVVATGTDEVADSGTVVRACELTPSPDSAEHAASVIAVTTASTTHLVCLNTLDPRSRVFTTITVSRNAVSYNPDVRVFGNVYPSRSNTHHLQEYA